MTSSTDTQSVEQYLEEARHRSVLRFSTMGSVDDGKSTLIGRLLHDSKRIYDDHLRAIEKESGSGPLELALLTDGLRAEREQGITIDVAYRYFSTSKRTFILADTPGHEQYTRNMATGASTANLAVLLIDARKGVITQTKRHAFIAALLGVPRILVTINKMDLVDYSREIYQKIREDFLSFATRLQVRDIQFIPISALVGDNVVTRSEKMDWFEGEPVMTYLENVYIGSDRNLLDFRFPVQYVLRPNQDYRGYAGQVVSGIVRVGDEVTVLPSRRRSQIKSIEVFDRGNTRNLEEAFAPMSPVLTLDDEVDISRGDVIVRSNNLPSVEDQFEAMVVWMSEEPLDPGTNYFIRQQQTEAKVSVDSLRYRVDVNTLHREEAETLDLNEIGRIAFKSKKPLYYDPYQRNRATGSFVLVHPLTYHTVAAGMIIDRVSADDLSESFSEQPGKAFPTPVSKNIHREQGEVSQSEREELLGGYARTLWFTGLSGSGKSSIARMLERKLFEMGRAVYRLDGDNVRFGLNRDLGFSPNDRGENIRRVAEVAKLLNDAGVLVLCSFISPFTDDRERVRAIIGRDRFVEIYLSTPLEECEKRDPHGLYQKARSGVIAEFTGVSSPYEAPKDPEIELSTVERSIDECVVEVLDLLERLESKLGE